MELTEVPQQTIRASAIGRPGYSQTLPRSPESAGTARRLVRTALATWRLEALTDAAALVVSELVANTVRHTRCRTLRVGVTRIGSARVRITVSDKSRVQPRRCDSEADDAYGRGLLLVTLLADDWRCDVLPWGKRIRVELTASEGDMHSAREMSRPVEKDSYSRRLDGRPYQSADMGTA